MLGTETVSWSDRAMVRSKPNWHERRRVSGDNLFHKKGVEKSQEKNFQFSCQVLIFNTTSRG
jgi:hypothetical protein